MTLPASWQRFQAVLLEALDTGEGVAVVSQRAGAAAPDGDVEQWVSCWDPTAVELASLLVRTWSLRGPD